MDKAFRKAITKAQKQLKENEELRSIYVADWSKTAYNFEVECANKFTGEEYRSFYVQVLNNESKITRSR